MSIEPLTDAARVDLLWQLYDSLLTHLHTMLTSGDPVKASLLDCCRHFLNDNGINGRSRADLRHGLQSLADIRSLPFSADGDKNN